MTAPCVRQKREQQKHVPLPHPALAHLGSELMQMTIIKSTFEMEIVYHENPQFALKSTLAIVQLQKYDYKWPT